MCGIVGFVNLKRNIKTANDKEILEDMMQTIARRGPDEDGLYQDEHVAMGHKRLIVIDPEGGKQPMNYCYHENTYTIVYNGQLYNTKELKKELEEADFTFETHSDTEVLLKGFIHWGYEIVHKMNGIFAFAIWDSKKQELFFARDHFGVKPFYYTVKDDT